MMVGKMGGKAMKTGFVGRLGSGGGPHRGGPVLAGTASMLTEDNPL